ncbi:hypothetical protein IFM89_033394 [Coptis chinensis]|uniref:Uncharacterized protein n=1 Tax=Coptis chinensis TaxID=261450 RepID=A0A835HZB4_9MAGN|nr:hypothetical protein IFM89_033394 [Coptis chinensis]
MENKELEAIGSSCQLLEELRVFPEDPFDQYVALGGSCGVTEAGFIAVSRGCRSLRYVLYFYRHMSNLDVATVVKMVDVGIGISG